VQKHKQRYIPFQYKLLLSYLLLVILPVSAIGSYSYFSSVMSTERHTRSNLEVAMKQISNNVQYRVDDVIRSSEEIYADQVLSRYLSGYYLNLEKYQATTQYVLPRLESALYLPKHKVKLTVYLDKATISEFYYNETEQSLIAGERQYAILYTDRIKEEPWYSELELASDALLWKQVGKDADYGYISLLRPLINYETFQSIGLIRVSVKLKEIFEDVDFNLLGQGTQLFVVHENQQLLYASSNLAADNSSPVLLAGDKRFLPITKEMSRLPVQLVALIPVSSISENSDKVRNVTIVVCVLTVLVMTLISMLIANMLSKRMMKLTVSLRAFKEGQFHRRIHYRGRDEFADIADSFNDMASTTQALIDEVYISKLEKKEAELQILHAQINPHFLYNTFSSISRMAKLGEIGKLHEIIRALAKFYRLTLNKGEMLITLEKELQIIEAYLTIQNMKYADRIQVTLEADPDTAGCETVKFILQPFVENILEHAWEADEICISISIFRRGREIYMEIKDNGLGMSQSKLDAIFADGPERIGYGIRNVDERIKLHYGKQYGVAISSELKKGTIVHIRFPAVVYKEGGMNSQ
jgi:two-component system sensor histidine kinase YesM